MKTKYNFNFFASFKVSFFWLIFLISFAAFSQEDENEIPTDSVGFNKGKIELNNPPSIVSAYTYDPVTDRYIYNSKIG